MPRIARRLLVFGGALLLALPGRADLPDVITRVKPSVVAVGTFKATDNPRFSFSGTGFVVAPGNLVVTAAHVLPANVGDVPALRVVVQGDLAGREGLRVATAVAVDRVHDLALLKIDGAPLPALALADPKDVREGQSIALMGFPIGSLLGFIPVTHSGIISAFTTMALPPPSSQQLNEKSIRQLREGNFELYQLDATAYPGNSGGPLFDAASGQVVGVLDSVIVRGTRESALSAPTGISYAIPVRFIHELLAQTR